MSAEFNNIQPKFYNEYINGSSFSSNLGIFSNTLKGNVGELVKVVHEVSFSVSVNEIKSIDITWTGTTDPTYGNFRSNSLNFYNEGLFPGAFIDVDFNGVTVTGVKVVSISGKNFSTLNVEKAGLLLAGIRDGSRVDYQMYLTTAPKYLVYKYGLNAIDLNQPNYTSPFDNNEQAYYNQSLATSPSLSTLKFKGNEIGSDLSESVEANFVSSSVDKRTHYYTLEHIFRIPFYLDGELDNIETSRTPQTTNRPINVKYGYGFFFGDNQETKTVFEDVGGTSEGSGSVGYFDQNFDGQENFYLVSSFLITNSFNSNKIEATLTNTVNYSIVPVAPAVFSGGEDVIIYHSKLPNENEYKNSKEGFEDIWVFDSLKQTEGAAAGSSTIITNATVTYNGGTGNLDVQFDVAYNASQKEKFDNNGEKVLFYATIGTQNLGDPNTNDKSNIKGDTSDVIKDTDQYGLVTQFNVDIYEQWDYAAGTKKFSNFDGYNGDFLGQEWSFLTDTTVNSVITSFDFKIVADDGTDFFELFKYSIPITKIATVNDGTYQYQILSLNAVPTQNDFNIPSSAFINEVLLYSVIPAAPQTTQQWFGRIGFQIPWREWIENLNVPTSFVDAAEPNDNRNQRTSNYSVAPYTIKTCLSMNIQSGDGTLGSNFSTDYNLLSDSSEILDFNDPGIGTFSHNYVLYDANNDPTSDLFFNSEVRIEIEFPHTLGILSLNDLQGMIWIEKVNDTGQPYFLSTDQDFTNVSSPIKPSQKVSSTNTTFVEKESIFNKVTLICLTNVNNLIPGANYNIYGRLGKKL